ncbi:hypothetical protein OV203_46000 [Nannocystis sp. ILAH1]|uniref:hypothetical protein n=1 Tax=Nannocystis sp. ILAH1 TaxID=2996789 RepID=UPI00226EAC9E|nr:hypothetical protein [Nannocystis sp. ILAH1]MCY0994565.1 hypothetical protein [Nannocystis sp. ILAH1]
MGGWPRRTFRALVASARTLAFPALGAAVGLVLCAAAASQVRALSPHDVLRARAPDRLYVTLDCQFSRQALDLLAVRPGSRPMLPIAADLAPTPERAALCEHALTVLRSGDGVWWKVLPDDYLCGLIAAEAREWLSSQVGESAQVPAWVVDGALVESGMSEAALDALHRRDLLAALDISEPPGELPNSFDSANHTNKHGE